MIEERVCCVVNCGKSFSTHPGKKNYYIDQCDDCLNKIGGCSSTCDDDPSNSSNLGDHGSESESNTSSVLDGDNNGDYSVSAGDSVSAAGDSVSA
ncbi:MAG: hypothetical protein ACOVR6_12250, partial [Fimbriimonas sp.]